MASVPLSIVGPFGVEEAVMAGGAFYTLVFFLVIPFIWSWQESQITAELSCAFPSAAGGVLWCEVAFGPYAGWLNGILSWVSGATDNAIYPVLFLDYLVRVLPTSVEDEEKLHPIYRFCLLASIAILMGYMNWRGLELVGNASIVVCIVAMSPFLVLTLLSIPTIDTSRWFAKPTLSAEEYAEINDYQLTGGFFPNASLGGVLLRPFINSLFWNMNSFDSAGAFSEEVGAHPERIIPKALNITWFMLLFGYSIPLFAAIGAANGTQADWSDGYIGRFICLGS